MKIKHAVLFGDTHVPYQDEAALDAVSDLIEKVRPSVLVHMGDFFDCMQLDSKFLKDPLWRDSVQDNIDAGADILNAFGSLAPKAKLWLLEGNHEDRLRRAIWSMSDNHRTVAGMRVFEKYITWPSILKDAGVKRWQWLPMDDQSSTEILPNLILKHGDLVRGHSGMSARAEWDKYHQNGASGHTHRLGWFLHRTKDATQSWAETGCTCGLNPRYTRDPNWHHGAIVVAYTDDWYNMEFVYIEDGRGRWRDQWVGG